MCFSIHKRIEGGATERGSPRPGRSRGFQYPQTDRRGCNHSFMIQPPPVSPFQYPQTDRRGCNSATAKLLSSCALVSVSTNGSKGVQLSSASSKHTMQDFVSVSTNGSKGVQQRSCEIRLAKRRFQYPQTDRRGCNQRGNKNRIVFQQVSVSTNGSKGVQQVIR